MKPCQNFVFSEIELSFLLGLKTFHKCFILDERMEPIACVLLYLVIKMWEALAWKSFSKYQIKHDQQ